MIKVLEKDLLDDDFIIKAFFKNIKLNQKINFNKDCIYYFGNYKENELEKIKRKITNNKKAIKKAVEKGVRIIIHGNSIELFNNSFNHKDINLFTYANNKKGKKIIKVNNLDKVITYPNFRYKNLICIK